MKYFANVTFITIVVFSFLFAIGQCVKHIAEFTDNLQVVPMEDPW
jgi:hypothetical protein